MLAGFGIANLERNLAVAQAFAKAVEEDYQGREFKRVGKSGVEVEDELARATGGGLLFIFGGRLAIGSVEDGRGPQRNERSVTLPEENVIGLVQLDLDRLPDKECLPVQAIHEGMFLGHDSAAQVLATLRGFVDHHDAVPGGEDWKKGIVGGKGEIGFGSVVDLLEVGS